MNLSAKTFALARVWGVTPQSGNENFRLADENFRNLLKAIPPPLANNLKISVLERILGFFRHVRFMISVTSQGFGKFSFDLSQLSGLLGKPLANLSRVSGLLGKLLANLSRVSGLLGKPLADLSRVSELLGKPLADPSRPAAPPTPLPKTITEKTTRVEKMVEITPAIREIIPLRQMFSN